MGMNGKAGMPASRVGHGKRNTHEVAGMSKAALQRLINMEEAMDAASAKKTPREAALEQRINRAGARDTDPR